MPETPTTRLSLRKPLNDGSELVNVQQDLNQNWDKIDTAVGFQLVTSTTRPSTPYAGKPIVETDTGRSYFHNGSSPASAGYVQIPNSASTFDADLDLTATRQLNIGGSGATSALATKLAAGSDVVLTSRVGSETQSRLTVSASGDVAWGSGSGATDVTLTRSAAGRLAVTGTNAALVVGSAVLRPQAAATVTVANSTTETVVGTVTIPASDAVAGAVYRVTVFGTASVTGAPTFTLRGRLGGVAGTLAATIGAVTASTGVTAQAWSVDFDLVCLTTGGSGTWMPRMVCTQNVTTTVSTQTGTVILPNSLASITRDTTASSDMVITWQWSAASASNTATARAFARRIA